MQRATVGGFLFLVACILLACLIARTGAFREGFQATVTGASNFRILNSAYPFKEVFLVAPVDSKGDIGFKVEGGDPDVTLGLTKEEAQAKCAEFGGSLATYDQATKAYDLSGHWCAPAWVSDRTRPVVSVTAANVCTRFPAKGITEDTVATTKAFALCYASKPPEPSRDVVPFSIPKSQYSMISDDAIKIIQTGYPVLQPPDLQGLSPATFTADHARYAFDTQYFNKSGAAYDPKALRRWLVDNYPSVSNTLQGEISRANNEPADRDTGWSTDARGKTCSDLRAVQAKIVERIKELRDVIKSIQEATTAAVRAKFENGEFQRKVKGVCMAVRDAAASPACRKLATLDSDQFYKDVASGAPNMLQRLEDMNFTLGARECEFQQVLGALERVATVLRCDLGRSAEDAALLGTNPYLPPGTCPKGLTDASPNFMVGKAFAYNDVEVLKLALMEISPFYSNDAFKALIDATLSEVSYILRVPQLNDYADAKQNFESINKMLDSIRALVPTIA